MTTEPHDPPAPELPLPDDDWTAERVKRAGDLATRWMRGESMLDLIRGANVPPAQVESDVRMFMRFTIRGDEYREEARRLRAILKSMSAGGLGDGALVEVEFAEVPPHLTDGRGVVRTLANFVVCSATHDERSLAAAVGAEINTTLKELGININFADSRITGTEADEGGGAAPR